eukprot:TRINITY_DN2964_c0_g2_i3.p2 TRINITY_DN2964_c0_g2~~TRINITY_DN2964_c0_g2_i3.p2  ORF type:complete len:137 (+),score=41.35 TRINITY_DN2964_c0_g2_i3:132-542(+)
MSYAMLKTYGMDGKIGLLSYRDNAAEQFYKPYSEETGREIDRQARAMVQREYERVKELLKAKTDLVEVLCKSLQAKETLLHSDLRDILGERPFSMREEYSRYVAASGGFEESAGSDTPHGTSEQDVTPVPTLAAKQ